MRKSGFSRGHLQAHDDRTSTKSLQARALRVHRRIGNKAVGVRTGATRAYLTVIVHHPHLRWGQLLAIRSLEIRGFPSLR